MFRRNIEANELRSASPSKRPRLGLSPSQPHSFASFVSATPSAASSLPSGANFSFQQQAGEAANSLSSTHPTASGNDEDRDLEESIIQALGVGEGFYNDIFGNSDLNPPRAPAPWSQNVISLVDSPQKPTAREPAEQPQLPLPPPPEPQQHHQQQRQRCEVVDLTADNEDDDLVLLSEKKVLPQPVIHTSHSRQPAIDPSHVLYGTLRNLFVDICRIPHPGPGARAKLGETGIPQWPPIPVIMRRSPPNTPGVPVVDCLGAVVGYLQPESARIVMRVWSEGLGEFRAWLYIRPIRQGEHIGMQLKNRLQLKMFANVYGSPDKCREISRVVTARNSQLDMPYSGYGDKGIRYLNPHNVAMRDYRPVQTSYASYQSRNEDDIKQDVQKIFDDLEATENLPEMNANELVKTELIKHQKQGLYFMTEHEKPRRWKEDGTEVNGLLKRIERRKDSGSYEYKHLITNDIYDHEPPAMKGGMLADMMGLGKTLQILSLIAGSLDEAREFANGPKLTSEVPADIGVDEPYPPVIKSKATLLIAPLSTITNWEEQIQAHIAPNGLSYCIWHGSRRLKDPASLAKYDLVITTYTLVGNEYRAHLRDRKKSFGPLQQTKWFRIVLDEAHTIREPKASLTKGTFHLAADRRWAVTGTPIQNRLEDFYSLLVFLQYHPFNNKTTFLSVIHNPIKTGDERVLPRLRALVHSMCLRRLKDKIDLPPREDVIEFVKFDTVEQQLHDQTMATSARKVELVIDARRLGGQTYIGVLQMIMRMRLICAHGRELLGDEDFSELEGTSTNDAIDLEAPAQAAKPKMTKKQAFQIYRLMQETNEDVCFSCRKKCASNLAIAAAATAGFNGSDDEDEDVKPSTKSKGKGKSKAKKDPREVEIKSEVKEENASEPATPGEGADDSFGGYLTSCAHLFCKDCLPAYNTAIGRSVQPLELYTCPVCQYYGPYAVTEINLKEIAEAEAEERKQKTGKKTIANYYGPSPKVRALLQALLMNREEGDPQKGDIIKSIVFSSWTTHLDLIAMALEKEGIVFVRLDGTMTRTKRTESMRLLREDPKVEVMLVSLLAGGLGLNLTSASRVYMMEPHYNPAAEAQAVDRIHRLGQKRPVKCVRFIMKDSFELKILDLQKKKTELANLTFSQGKKLTKEQMSKQKLEELRSLFK